MILLNSNLLQTGTFTTSTENEKYSFSVALGDPALSRWAKFTGNSGEYLQTVFTGATTIYTAYLLNTNLSSGATVQLVGSNNNFSTSTAYNLTQYGKDWVYLNLAGVSFSAYRIVITDSSVTSIRLSKAYIGDYTSMPGYEPSVKFGMTSNAVSAKSDSGQIFGYNRVQLRSWSINFPADSVDDADREAMEAYFLTYDKSRPCVWIIAEDSMDVEPPLYANLTKDIEFTKTSNNGLSYSYNIELQECK